MRARDELAAFDGVAHDQGRQHHLAVGELGLGVVLPFDVRARKPGKAITRPLAENSASWPWASPSGTIVVRRICALVPVASVIWEATVRFQISSYRRSSSPDRACAACSGVRKDSPDGRMAPCASWSFLTLRS